MACSRKITEKKRVKSLYLRIDGKVQEKLNALATPLSLREIVKKFGAPSKIKSKMPVLASISLRQKSDCASWQRAAVLVGLIDREDEVHLLLTRRTQTLHKHKGQIAFPGGKREEQDQSDEETALREANEEVGLDRRDFQKLGELACYYTSTGYEIRPVVGIIDKAARLTKNEQEVSEIFSVPLSYLMEPENYVIASKTVGKEKRSFYAIFYENYYIWGATAGMIRSLLERLS